MTLLSSSRAWPPVNPALTVQGYSHNWQPQLAVPGNSPLILAGRPSLSLLKVPRGITFGLTWSRGGSWASETDSDRAAASAEDMGKSGSASSGPACPGLVSLWGGGDDPRGHLLALVMHP